MGTNDVPRIRGLPIINTYLEYARSHTALIIRENLNKDNIPQMKRPPYCKDLNLMEHLFGLLGERISSLVLASEAVNDLRRALLRQLAVISQDNI